MSCSLLTVSQVNDVEKLESLLEDLSSEDQDIIDKGFGDDFTFDDESNWSDGWDSDAWAVEVEQQSKKPAKKVWLQSCKISFSPTEELIAVAKEEKAIFLSRKWPKGNSDDKKPFYEISWTGQLTTENESSQGCPDWTCVIAGFSTGYIRIYTSNGTQLLSQFLHDGPVMNMKIKTKSHFNLDQVEEMVILYQKAIVTIDGFSLYQSLRACRNQLAKSQASYASETIEPPPLAYRKWRTDSQKNVSDCSACGVINPCFYDRLRTACVNDGPRATVKTSTPAFNSFVTTGSEPFLCVYQALEGSNQPILSDVAFAYASKLTSAVFSKITSASSWLGVGGFTPQKSPVKDGKPQVEMGSALPARFGLFDQHRLTENIYLSPIGHLALLTDQYNRVLLVNTATGVIIRVWKGYRGAECGWIVVEEEEENEEIRRQQNQKPLRRRALFAVIYAPKRGILEIYLSEHGNRVGAFNVGKTCRLVFPPYQCLGQTRSPTGFNCNELNQCFLLMADGTIKTIRVPFHCALSNVHSIRAKDLHQLKRISTMIEKCKNDKKTTSENDSLVSVLLDIQAPNTQRKAVETILKTTGITSHFLRDCLEKICHSLKMETINKEEDLEYQSEKEDLFLFCSSQKHLVDLYISLQDLKEQKRGPDLSLDTNIPREQKISDILHITVNEANQFLDAIDRYKNSCLNSPYKSSAKIPERNINVTNFLTCFLAHIQTKKVQSHGNEGSSPTTKDFELELLLSIMSKETLLSLGGLFYQGSLEGTTSISELTLILETSKIPPNQLLILLTTYTQSNLIDNKALMSDSSICFLHSLVASICSIKGGADNDSELPVGNISEWWQDVRDVLIQSNLIGQSLIMATICRSVAMEITSVAHKVKLQDESDITDEDWEPITMEMESWNLLVSQLEHLIDIDCFIHTNHSKSLMSGVESPTLKRHIHSFETKKQKKITGKVEKEKTSKVSERIPLLSVQGVINNGPDLIAQLVADCLVRQGVPGYCLGSKKPKKSVSFRGHRATGGKEIEVDDDAIMDDAPEDDESASSPCNTLGALIELREKFPFTLKQDMLWVHCVWESIMAWNEDTEDLSLLRSALIHLSCIHNSKVQQGLGMMIWKAVFKESVKSTFDLITKVGKAPKDRLCLKNLGLSYKALEEFLGVGKSLLEILMDLENDVEEMEEMKIESIWNNAEISDYTSIVKQALEEPEYDHEMLNHFWGLLTTMHLVMAGNMRSVKILLLFDTKGKHAFSLGLQSTPVLSSEFDDNIIKTRRQFCCECVNGLVKQHMDLTFDDNSERSNTSNLLHQLNIVLSLATVFKVEEEYLKRHIARKLYADGLDIVAQEFAMEIEDKETFSSEMMTVVGSRLVKSMLQEDKFTETISRLPTNISSWLKQMSELKMNVAELPTIKTYQLLQYLNSNLTSQSRDAKLIRDLIEHLKDFL